MIKKDRLHITKIIGITIFNLICLFSVIYCIFMNGDKSQAISGESKVTVINEFEAPAQGKAASSDAKAAENKLSAAGAPFGAAADQIQKNESIIIVDDFSGGETKNRFGSKANVYVRSPSRIMISKRDETINAVNKKALMLKYDKKNAGGPNDTGGWCGYYTILKDERTGRYFDGTNYNYVTFYLRGEKGDENFVIGLADEHWDKMGDSLKSEQIGTYLPSGKVTTQWQKAKVPLNIFFLDHATLSALTFNFEADCFPDGAGSGVIYISDIAVEK